ncbi:hypothetical protein [Micromonospora psammae]|uniref:hypothetical protein n=1 Tax=Micromonospora sp. CPCC 205556 TaxID=3122398 RepID=UPI002FF1B2E4
MGRILRPDARTVAVVASLAAIAVLVVLVVGDSSGVLPVVLALLAVLLATIAGTAVSAMRDRNGRQEDDNAGAGQPDLGTSVLDADTLDALDSAAVRSRPGEPGRVSDR